ncbi:MAG: nitroreductase [Robiginitomaculum sp.]|nr:MAG: nitroreductase [Robiginitomaculum sp.]
MVEFPEPPELAKRLAACTPSTTVLEFLNVRRSVPLALLGSPGPDAEQLDTILRLAARVPDHRRVVPWRFIVFEGDARTQAAEAIKKRYCELNPDASLEELDIQSRKFTCSPSVIALVSSPDEAHKTSVWEQQLTVGAVGQNLLLAANAAGFSATWLTYWYAFDPIICQTFGLSAAERIAGFFHLGTACEDPLERPRPDMGAIVSRWTPIA